MGGRRVRDSAPRAPRRRAPPGDAASPALPPQRLRTRNRRDHLGGVPGVVERCRRCTPSGDGGRGSSASSATSGRRWWPPWSRVGYTLGVVCWVASLAFRLTVVPWAATRQADEGSPPVAFDPLADWAGSLDSVHMGSAYAASAARGASMLLDGAAPAWFGWTGVTWGSTSWLAAPARPSRASPPLEASQPPLPRPGHSRPCGGNLASDVLSRLCRLQTGRAVGARPHGPAGDGGGSFSPRRAWTQLAQQPDRARSLVDPEGISTYGGHDRPLS